MLLLEMKILSTAGFLGHNVCSRHARRSMKGSIDADDCIVINNFEPEKNGSLD